MKVYHSSADRSREQYNPLRGLTIARAVQLLEQGQRGDFADLMWTYEFVEQTDPVLMALVERRTASICEMDWNVKQVRDDVKGYDPKLAEDQAEALREGYERIDNLYAAIEHWETGAFRGFAHCNPQYKNKELVHLEPLDSWNFLRDGRYGDWYWNPDARSVSAKSLGESARLKPQDLITHEVRRSIDRVGLIKFVRANLSEKDWDAYVEIYGIPAAFVILPENVPQEKESEYMAQAQNAAEGGSGALPGGSDIKFATDARGNQPFELRLEWLSKQLVLAGTGGLLTMLAESGSGTLAGNAHADTFAQIARARARKISEMLQKRIDREILERAFPDRPRLAYWELASEEEQDTGEAVEQIAKLSQYYVISTGDVEERTGYKVEGHRALSREGGTTPGQVAGEDERRTSNVERPTSKEDEEETTTDGADGADTATAENREPDSTTQPLNPDQVEQELADAALTAALEAEREDLQPLIDRVLVLHDLAQLDSLTPEQETQLAEGLQELRNALPQEAERLLDEDTALVTAMDNAISTAAVNGVAEERTSRGDAETQSGEVEARGAILQSDLRDKAREAWGNEAPEEKSESGND